MNQFLASRNIDDFCHCVIGAADDVAGRMRIRAARDHVLHANSTLPDRVDLAIAAIAVLSTGLSALAPAQRAGGVLGMLSSLEVKVFCPT